MVPSDSRDAAIAEIVITGAVSGKTHERETGEESQEMTAANSIRRGRDTERKRHIREELDATYRGCAVLLDELRWHVLGPKLSNDLDDNARRSLLNSFARTVRQQLTQHSVKKISLSPETPIGLVARTAVYRMRNDVFLRRFLNSVEPCILCRYKTNFDVDSPRFKPRSRYVQPHHHAATFRFFVSRPSDVSYDELETAPGTFIPATQKLTLVLPDETPLDIPLIANVPWKLFRYDDLSDWKELHGTDPLETAKRNRYY